jgi:hypothetical protein
MKMYRLNRQLVSDTCIASCRRLTWYLAQDLVVLSLADVSCPFRDHVAASLHEQEVWDSFRPRKP